MTTIDVDAVRLTFPGGRGSTPTVALDDVSLHVDDGELVVLLGPSGSGKTTLLRALAGFVQPERGRISLGGDTVCGDGRWVPPERRGLAMVFQQHAIWPHWDVARNVDYPLRRAGVDGRERRDRVAHALAVVGLADFGHRDPATLSGGQRQRVALARALAARPRALLLDEALSALDEPLRASMRAEIRRLVESERLTGVHVTHDRTEALAIADRVVVLREGRIEQVGTPADVTATPATAFVAGFLGDATVLDAVVEGDVVRAGELTVPASVVEHPGGERRATTGRLALLPEDVDVVADPGGPASVASALFARDGAELTLEVHGHALRARTRDGRRPVRGERVRVEVRRALFYPAE